MKYANIKVYQRSTYEWDIYVNEVRKFCVRNYGHFCVRFESSTREPKRFKSGTKAINYCIEQILKG